MGCDIHVFPEVLRDGQWQHVAGAQVFDFRNYGVFAFLAGVRNYSAIMPISPARGMPDNASSVARAECDDFGCDGHSHSWLLVNELTAVDYNQEIEDRRVTKQISPRVFSGGETCEQGEGHKTTLAEFLGVAFLHDVERMKALGIGRIVFWFDN